MAQPEKQWTREESAKLVEICLVFARAGGSRKACVVRAASAISRRSQKAVHSRLFKCRLFVRGSWNVPLLLELQAELGAAAG